MKNQTSPTIKKEVYKSQFSCPKCGEIHANFKGLERHVLTCGASTSFPCNKGCSETFFIGRDYLQHIQNGCGYSSNISSSKQDFMSDKSPCYICFQAISIDYKDDHTEDHGKSLHLNSRVYCPTCYEEIEPLMDLNDHHLSAHGNCACLKCFKTFELAEMAHHWESSHPETWFPCRDCEQEFISQTVLQAHVHSVHSSSTMTMSTNKVDSPPLTLCHICEEMIPHLDSHLDHEHDVTNKEQKNPDGEYLCPEDSCETILGSMKQTEDHVIVHTDIRPYSCRHCDFSSGFSGSIVRHSRKCHPFKKDTPIVDADKVKRYKQKFQFQYRTKVSHSNQE